MTPPSPQPVLHVICGKIAAGKSTLARRLAKAPGTVLIVEDEWLAGLYGDTLKTLADYRRCTTLLRATLGPHVATLLKEGVSVVLDAPANTRETRAWMREILSASGAADRLHLLMPRDAVCLARLAARNAAGTHPFAVSEAQFHAVSRHFEPPTEGEGFEIVRYDHPV